MNPRLSVSQLHDILDRWLGRTARNVELLGDNFPDYFDPQTGEWTHNGGWTEGFWTGILWWLYAYSKESRFKDWAIHYTRLLAARKATFADHDLGFLFAYSCALEHGTTGSDEMLPAALAAARRLAARYNPKGRFIRAHGELHDPERAGYTIIDTVMNLPLLLWAHRQTHDQLWYDIACETAFTIAREYVRPDGSSYQVVWYDPSTGAIERKTTLQGYSAESCWARGQAWGIAGFSQLYGATGISSFYDTAEAMANYFLQNLPADGVVYYDFDASLTPDIPKDTSAQAVGAAGLLTLAASSVGETRQMWVAGAERLLAGLLPYLIEGDEPRGFLGKGCYFLSQGRGVDSELIYGDYFLLEAIMKYRAFKQFGAA